MTYDLKVILKYCGRSSHDLLVLCGWSWPLSGPLLAVLCRSWSLCWRSWPTLGTSVGGLGLLLGPVWAVLAALVAVLGRSWALCWRSWAALGAYVGGLGPKNAKNMATMNMCLFLERERDLRPGGRS